MRPTDEQMYALDLFRSGESMVIEAAAGAGKTAVLRLLAASTMRRGRYTAFSRAIVEDVRGSITSRCEARTVHSLAFAAVGVRYKHRLDQSGRMKGRELARRLHIDAPIWVDMDGTRKALEEGYLGSHVMRAVEIFCQSADEEPGVRHFPYIDGIDMPDSDGHRTYDNNRMVAQTLEPALRVAWADLLSLEGQLGFRHSHYLKIWQLSQPTLSCDYILVDESQDVSPVMAAVLEGQHHAQTVWVGDQFQEVFTFTGARNMIQTLDLPNRAVLSLCQPEGTAVRVPVQVNGRDWVHRDVPIETLAEGDLVVSWGRDHGVRKKGRPVTAVNVRAHDGPVIVADVAGLQSRYAPNHHCVMMLGYRDSHVVYLMRRRGQYRVGRCPWIYGSSRAFGPKLRAKHEQADAVWVLSVHDTQAEAALAEATTQLRFGLPGESFVQQHHYVMPLDEFWQKVGDNAAEAAVCLRHHGRLLEEPLWSGAHNVRLGSTVLVTAAANLIDGMLLKPADGAWQPATISTEWYTGRIFSLSVAQDETYIGDGIVTHNSFRFGPAIAEVANETLALLDEPPRWQVRGLESIDSTVGALDDGQRPDAILTRTNACAITELLRAQQQDIRGHVVGGGTDVASFARGAQDLMQRGETSHPELRCFVSWNEVREYVAADALGAELKLMVDLIDKFTVPTILDAIEKMPPESSADIVISTSHRSKGREWPTVRIAEDFSDRMLDDAEIRLRYVACTRAQIHLDKTALEPAEEPEDSDTDTDEEPAA